MGDQIAATQKKAIVAGTFAYLHAGHRALLAAAFAAGDIVFIGLTTDDYLRRTKNQLRPSFEERKARIEEFARQFGKPFSISPLADGLGNSTTVDYDIIVVSEESKAGAMKINVVRAANGLKPLEVVVVEPLADGAGARISSTSIYEGKIDGSGRLLKSRQRS